MLGRAPVRPGPVTAHPTFPWWACWAFGLGRSNERERLGEAGPFSAVQVIPDHSAPIRAHHDAPEACLDRRHAANGLKQQPVQVGSTNSEASEGVVDLFLDCAALIDKVLRILPMQRLALLQALGDGVVDDHMLAVKGHLPGYLRSDVPAPAVAILVKLI
jgi:hypothetical protein